MLGRVVSAKCQKTATVLVTGTKTHPLYGKSYVSSKRYLVDDPLNVKEGDVVEFLKIRPISKNKHWRITKVVGQDIVALGTEALKESAQEAIAEVLPEKEEETEEVEASAPVEEPKKEKKTKKAKKETKKKESK